MNPFSTYRIIQAGDIVKANVRPTQVKDDLAGLISVLTPVSYIARPVSQRAANLHRQVIEKLESKSGTLGLLKHLGYVQNENREYIYTEPRSDNEKKARQDAVIEFQNFYIQLKKAKDDKLDGFDQFLRNSNKRSTTYDDDDDDYYQRPQERPTSRSSIRQPSPPAFPKLAKIKEGNIKTSEIITTLKENIITRDGGPPAHGFIRRKLLILLFKQKYPDSIAFGDQAIEDDIDRKITQLKQRNKFGFASLPDEVFIECLIRATYDEDVAFQMLSHNQPNLKPPPEPIHPRGPTTTTIANSRQPLQEQWTSLNREANENGGAVVLVHEGDEWKNAMHIIPAIIELRDQYNDQNVDELVLSKVYRLLYTELSSIIRQQSPIKIEFLASALCEIGSDVVQHITMTDLRDILNSCADHEVDESFKEIAVRTLSVACPLCAESFPRSQMETMFLCNHTFCLTCIKRYYRDAVRNIRDTKGLNSLTCMEKHDIPVNMDEKMNFFQYIETKLNQWFPGERLVLDAYHENLFIATRDSQIKKCGNTKCVGFFYPANNNRIARAQCPHCEFSQCQQCCRKWLQEHTNQNCEEYGEWLRENDPDDPDVQLLQYLNTAGMACPNTKCNGIFEYQPGGCEHFICPQCDTEFCRICSALFHNPAKNTGCVRPNCVLRNTLHAHCFLNCFREIRDAQVDEMVKLLNDHHINFLEELKQKPVATSIACPVERCKNPPSVVCENRFCETCYKQFLCLFVWRNQIEPWELYQDHHLVVKLTNASIPVPADATRIVLIGLAQQHLKQYLGKPKKMSRTRQ